MISSWRRLRAGRRAGKEQPGVESYSLKDLVTASTRITYDRVNVENKRIPTPRIPVSFAEVLEINSKISTACTRGDQVGCRDLVAKIKKWAEEIQGNKRSIVSNGIVSVLAAAFESFSETCNFDEHEHVSVLEEVLLTLTSLFPLHGEALTYLGSDSSMHCVVWFLKSGDLSGRRNAVLVLREVVSSDHSKVNILSEIEGATEELFKLIKEPICPTATKASLVVVYHTITSASANEKLIQKWGDMGLVSVLLEILGDAQTSVCEEALSVLDGICSSDYGRGEAYANSLTIPVIVKKILRVSDLATEFSVSILWKLCKNEKREEKTAFVEALPAAAFQKLFWVSQINCGEGTKEKVSELLKLLKEIKAGRRAGKEQPGVESHSKEPVTPSSRITFDRVNVENERIPTPRIPVSSAEALENNSKITTACKRGDQVGCRDLAAKIKKWAKEIEGDKRCIESNWVVSVLAAAFESFSETCNLDEHVSVLEQVLLTLTSLFPLHGEALTYLKSASSMRCLVWFLKSGDLSRRRNAVLVLREAVTSDDSKVNMLSEIEGATEELFKLIKEPICPTATKASLVVVYHTITSASANEKLIQKFAGMGLVSLLLEILGDAQTSVCEEALSVLDGICSSDYGRREAYANSLTIPVTVKQMLPVSDLATEFSVSILWKLCKNEKREEKTAFVEALQVGAFQKLLMLLHVGCGERTKEKVNQLLRLLNLHRAGLLAFLFQR